MSGYSGGPLVAAVATAPALDGASPASSAPATAAGGPDTPASTRVRSRRRVMPLSRTHRRRPSRHGRDADRNGGARADAHVQPGRVEASRPSRTPSAARPGEPRLHRHRRGCRPDDHLHGPGAQRRWLRLGNHGRPHRPGATPPTTTTDDDASAAAAGHDAAQLDATVRALQRDQVRPQRRRDRSALHGGPGQRERQGEGRRAGPLPPQGRPPPRPCLHADTHADAKGAASAALCSPRCCARPSPVRTGSRSSPRMPPATSRPPDSQDAEADA